MATVLFKKDKSERILFDNPDNVVYITYEISFVI